MRVPLHVRMSCIKRSRLREALGYWTPKMLIKKNCMSTRIEGEKSSLQTRIGMCNAYLITSNIGEGIANCFDSRSMRKHRHRRVQLNVCAVDSKSDLGNERRVLLQARSFQDTICAIWCAMRTWRRHCPTSSSPTVNWHVLNPFFAMTKYTTIIFRGIRCLQPWNCGNSAATPPGQTLSDRPASSATPLPIPSKFQPR